MKDINCPDCGEKQWSIQDKKYVELFSTGWCCDKKRWFNGELLLEELEKRERLSLITIN